jgi:hypothetical protein
VHLADRELGARGVEEPAAAEVPEHLVHRLLAIGADRVEDDAGSLAQRLRREACEVDPAAAIVAAVVRQPGRLPDRVHRDRLAHRERADAARVVIGLRRRRRGSRARRVARHHEQVGAPAQRADVVE